MINVKKMKYFIKDTFCGNVEYLTSLEGCCNKRCQYNHSHKDNSWFIRN